MAHQQVLCIFLRIYQKCALMQSWYDVVGKVLSFVARNVPTISVDRRLGKLPLLEISGAQTDLFLRLLHKHCNQIGVRLALPAAGSEQCAPESPKESDLCNSSDMLCFLMRRRRCSRCRPAPSTYGSHNACSRCLRQQQLVLLTFPGCFPAFTVTAGRPACSTVETAVAQFNVSVQSQKSVTTE